MAADTAGDFPGRMLHQACIYDNRDLLLCLLEGEERQFINCTDHDGRTPLYTAVTNNAVTCAKLLLNNGAKPDIACKLRFGRMTPLHAAAIDGKIEFIEILLAEGANLDVKDAMGKSPMDLANTFGHVRVVQFMKAEALHREKEQERLYGLLYNACTNGKLQDAGKVADQLGENVKYAVNRTKDGSTALERCVEVGDKVMLMFLLEHGSEGYAQPDKCITGFHIAAEKGHKEILLVLLREVPMLVHVANNEGLLPLHIACLKGFADIVQVLLGFPYPDDAKERHTCGPPGGEQTYYSAIDVNGIDRNGETPLYKACASGSIKIVGLLLGHTVVLLPSNQMSPGNHDVPQEFCPIQVDYTTQLGETALCKAVSGKQYKIAEMLLKRGADPNITIDDKCITLEKACLNSDTSMLNLLLKFDAQDKGNNVLKSAVSREQNQIITVLLQYYTHSSTEFEMTPQQSPPSGPPASPKLPNPETIIMIDWCNKGKLQYIRKDWILNAANFQNPNIPANFASVALRAITRIDISCNSIKFLPSFLFELPSLHVLNASHNQITEIELSVKNEVLINSVLETLSLEHNKLKVLPYQIFQLAKLASLTVCHNRLESLPYILWSSPSLVDLKASHNNIRVIPATPCTEGHLLRNASTGSDLESSGTYSDDCHSLYDSDAHETSVVAFEGVSSIDYKVVQHQTMWRGKVEIVNTDTHPYRSNYSEKQQCDLKYLDLSHNAIDSMSPGLACVAKGLMKLDISHNKLTDMGNVSFYPSSLTTLDISHNDLVGAATWQKVDSVPDGLLGLGVHTSSSPNMLHKSRARNSSSSSMYAGACLHTSHHSLESLKALKLDHNHLFKMFLAISSHSIEREDVKDLLLYPGLSELTLSKNMMSKLPPEVGCMEKLTVLNISNNNFSELPPELGLLTKLWNLDVTGNPIESSLTSTLGNYKTRDILGYYRSILENYSLYNRMKLMVVGIAKIGKTSLLQQLRKEGRSFLQQAHWTQRMGHYTGAMTGGDKSDILSTVGVDIGDLTIERRDKKVVFRTWDFGGQREYYATHQYFLSKRALYLAVWKLSDGEKGINELHQWLVNIQARAPNAPVIIVGTHLDSIKKGKFPDDFVQDMQVILEERFIKIPEPSKCGLPRVIGHVEVSCKARFNSNIAKLSTLIYDTVYNLKQPGSKDSLLLEQKVPVTYIQLEEVIESIAKERRRQGEDPVLNADQYKAQVLDAMMARYNTTFRDIAELNLATKFLHENGVLLHYEDVYLQDMYFLDPQWLSDMLAHVVTIREINPLARKGVMRTADLKMLFKNSSFRPDDINQYIINLLNKFEIALLWDSQHLLIPSLLPTERQLKCEYQEYSVRIPVKGTRGKRGTSITVYKNQIEPEEDPTKMPLPPETPCGKSCFYVENILESTEDETHVEASPVKNALHMNSNRPKLSPVVDTTDNVKKDYIIETETGLMIENINYKGVLKTIQDSNLPIISKMVASRSLSSLETDSRNGVSASSGKNLPSPGMSSEGLPNTSGNIPSPGVSCSGMSTSSVSSSSGYIPSSGVPSPGGNPEISSPGSAMTDSVFGETMSASMMSELQSSVGSSDNIRPDIQLGPLNPLASLCRLYIMSYFPCGFWPRLITRLLGDGSFLPILNNMYTIYGENNDEELLSKIGTSVEWHCWETGVRLTYRPITNLEIPLLSVKEVFKDMTGNLCDYEQCTFKIHQEGIWSDLDMTSNSILEILIPNYEIDLHNASMLGFSFFETRHCRLRLRPEVGAQLLTKLVDHVDTLLEDWYPDLGTRFTQTTRGDYLIYRMVPCPRCVQYQNQTQLHPDANPEAWSFVDYNTHRNEAQLSDNVAIVKSKPDLNVASSSVDPRTCGQFEALGSLWGSSSASEQGQQDEGEMRRSTYKQRAEGCVFCYTIEQCILWAQKQQHVCCPRHGSISPCFVVDHEGNMTKSHIAPDLVFMDLGPGFVIQDDFITRGRFLGKGSFGAVFAGSATLCDGREVEVAMKMLEPVHPGENASFTQIRLFQNERALWAREQIRYSCEAYVTARRELSILQSVSHPHIVAVFGLSLQPLSLIISLAPQGSLDTLLLRIAQLGNQLSSAVIQDVASQVASALVYLHSKQIIYRDLKSENVLVWTLPMSPQEPQHVLVKLADYGISRAALPMGTKGLAGTPGFIAPEILQHNGEEPYTEKVDCYSFGMFLYELLALHMPYANMESVRGNMLRAFVLEKKGRPSLTQREVTYPAPMLNLMTMCWAHEPAQRPSAAEISAIVTSPEFSTLMDVVAMEKQQRIVDATIVAVRHAGNHEEYVNEVWLATSNPASSSIEILTLEKHTCVEQKCILLDNCGVLCLAAVGEQMWCATTDATIFIYRVQDTVKIKEIEIECDDDALRIISISPLSSGLVLVTSRDGGLYLYNKEGTLVKHVPVEQAVHCVATGWVLERECIFLGHDRTVMVYQVETEKITFLTHSNANAANRISHISPTKGELYVTLESESVLYRWNTSSGSLSKEADIAALLNIKQGGVLISHLVQHDDKLYVGTDQGHLVVIPGKIEQHNRDTMTTTSNTGNDHGNTITSPRITETEPRDVLVLHGHMAAVSQILTLRRDTVTIVVHNFYVHSNASNISTTIDNE
ncbi:unnamed protein product [Owenia fusiformis]|uniref:non-specific serine/threonine protein kinase n=1 Tax=Owenia fusiformis TaxID=6347 RepID=A0A8J1XJ88_OWEFU|nr:unnamed protein product [Owenia fusiformis]